MELSQNGWPVITDRTHLREWQVPADNGAFVLPLRPEQAGFVLVHCALWFAEEIEPVAGQGDDFGWALRTIPPSNIWSNHASGTAEDLNASAHPYGKRGTFSSAETAKIRDRLTLFYESVIRWGGDYHSTVDEMHFEINAISAIVDPMAKRLVTTPRGKRIIAANHGLGSWAA